MCGASQNQSCVWRHSVSPYGSCVWKHSVFQQDSCKMNLSGLKSHPKDTRHFANTQMTYVQIHQASQCVQLRCCCSCGLWRLLDYICLPEGIFVLHHLFTWSKLNVSHHEVLCLGFILTQNCLTLLWNLILLFLLSLSKPGAMKSTLEQFVGVTAAKAACW